MKDLQPADARECRDILTAVGNFGELALEEAGIKFEVVALPHFYGEMMAILLGLLTRGVLVRNALVTSSKLRRERGGRE